MYAGYHGVPRSCSHCEKERIKVSHEEQQAFHNTRNGFIRLHIQDDIHLGEGKTLGLGQHEVGPGAGQQHPGGEEEPSAVAEGREDVRKRLSHGELDSPLAEGGVGTREVTKRTGEDLGGDDPGDTVETERPAIVK